MTTTETTRSDDSAESGQRAQRAAFATVSSPYYPILMAAFVAVMLISNIAATKGVQLFGEHGVVTDGAFFLFPLSYVIGDVISEVYGFRAMRRTILTGFAILLLASLTFTISIALPPLADYPLQSEFSDILGAVPQLVAASLAGFLVGEFLNSYVLVRMKTRAGEKRLWSRLITSTVVGELFDTVVFCAIAAPVIGATEPGTFINYVVTGVVIKCAVEILVMPITYGVVRYLKRREPSYIEALAAE
ncbi:MAG: queuosine precursor transporter [Gordonia sp. (in: high G+C Gram-positive bacteria)]